MHRPAVSAPLPGLFITSLPRRQRCGSGAAANNGAEAGAAAGGFPTGGRCKGMDVKREVEDGEDFSRNSTFLLSSFQTEFGMRGELVRMVGLFTKFSPVAVLL